MLLLHLTYMWKLQFSEAICKFCGIFYDELGIFQSKIGWHTEKSIQTGADSLYIYVNIRKIANSADKIVVCVFVCVWKSQGGKMGKCMQ